MADLSDLQSADAVKIVGSDLSGVETYPIASTITTPSLSEPGMVVRPLPYEPVTYSAAAVGYVIATAATDIYTIIGSASKVIRINKIRISATTTSGTPIKVSIVLIKRSTLNTGGTRVAGLAVRHDSLSPAAAASVGHYTANPTLGTSLGPARSASTSVTTSGVSGGDILYDFERGGEPMILRGASELLAVNLNGGTVSGPIVSVCIEWIEV